MSEHEIIRISENERINTRELDIIQSRSMDENPAAVYLSQLNSKSGRRSQAQALGVIAAMFGQDAYSLDWSKLRYQHTAAIRSRLMESYKPATVNKFLSAIRGVLKQAWQLGQMSAEDYHRAAELKSVINETLPAGRDLTRAEIRALINDCMKDDSNIGVRDGAIIALLAAGGLRGKRLSILSLMITTQKQGNYWSKVNERKTDIFILIMGQPMQWQIGSMSGVINQVLYSLQSIKAVQSGKVRAWFHNRFMTC